MIRKKPTSPEGARRRFETIPRKSINQAKTKYEAWMQRLGWVGVTIFFLIIFLFMLFMFKQFAGYNRVYTKGDNIINIIFFLLFMIFARMLRKGRDYDPQGIGNV